MPTYFMLVKLIPTLPHMLGLDPATYLKGIMCFLKSLWYCVCDICLFFPQHNFVQQYVDKTALTYFFVLFAAPKSCRGHMLETVQNTEDHLLKNWRDPIILLENKQFNHGCTCFKLFYWPSDPRSNPFCMHLYFAMFDHVLPLPPGS